MLTNHQNESEEREREERQRKSIKGLRQSLAKSKLFIELRSDRPKMGVDWP